MEKRTMLITGIHGLVGQYLFQLLKGGNFHMVATGKGPCRIPGFAETGFTYLEMDITDAVRVHEVFRQFSPDIVVHAAALAQPDFCEQHPAECWLVNVTATRFLADAAKKCGAFFIFLSTDFVFDGSAGPYREDDPPNPVNYYGCSKLAAEKAVMETLKRWAIIRTVLVYGNTIDGTRTNIITWVKRELEKGNRIRVVSDQVRTPTYAGDLAAAILVVAEKQATGTWHISGKDILTPYDAAMAVSRKFGLPAHLIEKVDASSFSQPARRPPRTGFLIQKARTALGYEPHTFAEGIDLITQPS